MTNTFTVVINTYQEDRTKLIRAIESYLEQQSVEVDVLISTVKGDPSIEVAKSMGVRYTYTEEKGIYDQLNNAVKHLKGYWFCYASGNDYAYPDKLLRESIIASISKKKVCYSNFDMKEEWSGKVVTTNLPKYTIRDHLTRNFISDCSLINTDLLKKYMPFRNDIWGNHSFYDLWLRIFYGEGDVFVLNPIPTWLYVVSRDSKRMTRERIPAEHKRNKLLRKKMSEYHRKILMNENLL